jgi:hypothetical protein
VKLHTAIPESLFALLTAHLYSPVEGRVPKGAYQSWLMGRIQEYFSWRKLDLAPYGFPPGYFVVGPKEMTERLEADLQRVHSITEWK